MLRWCVPGALLAYADYAVAHFPTPERRYGDEVLSAVDAELPELFGALVASCTQPVATASAESAFAAVGRNLLAACDRSPGDFQDLIGGLWARTISAYVEEALSTYESPRVEGCGGPDDDRYDSDLRQHLSSLRESLLAESTAVPADIFARLDDSPNRSERAVAAFQDLVRQYGVLLCNWPRVFQAAVQVAEGGG
jgi:hypothetical protein